MRRFQFANGDIYRLEEDLTWSGPVPAIRKFLEDEIKIEGYGYPKTVIKISEQVEYLFDKKVTVVFEDDFPRKECHMMYPY